MTYVISGIVGIVFAVVCYMFTVRKGYNPILFAILGFFFSLITFIVILVLPDKNKQKTATVEDTPFPSST